MEGSLLEHHLNIIFDFDFFMFSISAGDGISFYGFVVEMQYGVFGLATLNTKPFFKLYAFLLSVFNKIIVLYLPKFFGISIFSQNVGRGRIWNVCFVRFELIINDEPNRPDI